LNALKFTPTYGSVKLSIQPYSYLASSSPSSQNFYQLNHFRLNASYIRITVQDTGKGLPVDKLPYIFDRYYQVETTAVSSIGTGIGLALTKELVTLLEGVIQVESELGGGSTFSIYLPVSNEPAVQAPKQEQMVSKEASFQLDLAIAPTSSIEDSRPIVLLVEDNLDVIYYLKTCIGKKYQVLETTNGKKGLEKAIEVIPDIIISDVMMPEMDGYELGKALQANSQTSHIPFLLLTAKTSQESKRQGLAAGALAYLTKPFDQEELLIRLQHLLAWRKQLQIFLLHQDQSSTPQLIKSTAAFNKERTFLDQVNQQILQHLEEEDFKAPQLAQAMAMSESQLYRKLKAVTDHSTAKYLQLTRLKEAQSMLETMDISISEVAHKVGFKQTSHFSKAFKAYFGKTPSEWSK